MTGFRLSKGGAQELYNVKPDLTTLGKIIGGGMPVGAYGGKKEIMDMVAPAGPVYQAGTLSGNPIAMAAGLAMLDLITANPDTYQQLEKTTKKIANGWKANADKLGIETSVNQIGSMFTLFFTKEKVTNFESAKTSDLKKFATYFQNMLNQGVYLAPSQYESLFVSTAITDALADELIEKNHKALTLNFQL